MLPDAFLLEAAKEPFDHSVLLGRVRGDELLRQPVVATRRPKAPTLEHQPVVASDHRGRPGWPERAEPRQARLLQRPLRFLSPPPQGELIADDFAVVAVDHRGEMG